MAIEERNNVCIGCGEAEGDPHKPGCDRYTSSPIVRAVDTASMGAKATMQAIRDERAAALPVVHEPGPDSPRGIPGPIVGGVPRLNVAAEDPRAVTLLTAQQVFELLTRVQERHPGDTRLYNAQDLVNDLHRDGDNPVPIVTEPRRSAASVVGWVDKLELQGNGDVKGRISTMDDSAWDVIRAGAGLAGNIAFDWTIKSDGQRRPVFLTEVVIQPPVPEPEPEVEPATEQVWKVERVQSDSQDRTWRSAPGYQSQEQKIEAILNRRNYKPMKVVALADGAVLVIGRQF